MSRSSESVPIADAFLSPARRQAILLRAKRVWRQAPSRARVIPFEMFGRRVEVSATTLGRLRVRVRK